nr:EAL domain-containing protein [Methylobacterium iners]
MPSYEAVVLGNLGRFADGVALIATEGGLPARILWCGAQFGQWLQRDAVALDVRELSDDLLQPLREVAAAALLSGEPARTRCDRVIEGIVVTTELLGLPLANRHGEPLILLGLEGEPSRYDLVKAMFSATDQGMLALSTVRDGTGAAVDFKIVALNEGAARMFGRPMPLLQWQRLTAVVPRLAETDALSRLIGVLGRTDRTVFELGYSRSDGSEAHVKIEAGCIGDLVAVTLTDIGDLKAREASVRLLFENNPLPMWLIDAADARFLAVNDAALSHYGYSRGQFLAMALPDLHGSAHTGPRACRMGSEALWCHRRADGADIEVNLFERAMEFDGRPAILGAVIDVTERRRAEARIAHMAHHDALTDLPNRVLFRDRLGEAIARQKRTGERALLLCLDLDHFKTVNDTLGHPAGDELLRGVAVRLAACLREEDVVARLGGDEFAILVGGSEALGSLGVLARRIIADLSRPFRILGQDVHVGASLGLARLPQDGDDPDLLLRNADLALYRAKGAGRGTYRCFEPEMDAQIQARRALEQDLREAFAAGRLAVFYQPLIATGTGRITGFEALLRWKHAARGFVPPAEFVPLAEETGLIGPIGEWVLRTACAEAATWAPQVRIAVNLSPAQFRNRALVETVARALADSGLAPDRLALEITETVLLAENEAHLAILHRLRSLGVRIAMDDFGTGYSSLSYLRSFPFDKIKIDRSFVRELGASAHCAAIVRAVAGLGASLGIVTTAEGVKTPAQLARLRAEGCDEVQGFLFSHPLPVAEARRLLASDGEGERLSA